LQSATFSHLDTLPANRTGNLALPQVHDKRFRWP
ncbi:MAG: hypothetical protein RL749_851, partial [Verrucomicrobiota bacterium]